MLQLPTQLTEQSFAQVPVSVNELGQANPPFAEGVVTVKVLVLVPGRVGFIPSQVVALEQGLHSFGPQTQFVRGLNLIITIPEPPEPPFPPFPL